MPIFLKCKKGDLLMDDRLKTVLLVLKRFLSSSHKRALKKLNLSKAESLNRTSEVIFKINSESEKDIRILFVIDIPLTH
jgi:hypothetical protein